MCAETLPISEPIYEFGALQVRGPRQEGFADLRPFFPGKKYIGADMREGPGVDVILNLHNIELPSESVGTVLMMDTLEHVEFPRKAIGEVYRILTSEGILIMSSLMYFPIHGYPQDFWRFTPEAFKSLLKPFTLSVSDSVGDTLLPHTIVGVGFKGSIAKNVMDEFLLRLKHWKTQWLMLTLLGAFTPPIFFTTLFRIFSHLSREE
jgi:SAM-dependent methyltransferase